MDKIVFEQEKDYLDNTLNLVNEKLNKLEKKSQSVENTFSDSNTEYFDYLKHNANKMNEDDVVELVNMQTRLDDIEEYSDNLEKDKSTYKKMLDKPYFASIDIKEDIEDDIEKYYIGIHSLTNDKKEFKVIDWRSPISSIFYDYEQGECQIKTNSSIMHCNLLAKRQFGIEKGKLNYYIDSTINIEDNLLQEALAKNTTSKMKSIIQTIQKEQNEIIRGDENKNMIVQGIAGSGKTAIALHRIAYLLYKMKGRIESKDIHFISPNNAFSSYISSVLPDLAEDDIEKKQLDTIAHDYLKKHLILERKYEQIERLIDTESLDEYNYKSSYQFLKELLKYAYSNYIESFSPEDFDVNGTIISGKKIKELFFDRYKDRDLFTRIQWITDNIFDMYFYRIKKADTIVRIKQVIFLKIYRFIPNKNCVKAYMNFLKSKNMKLTLVGDKVKNEDAYAILFFKMFIYGLNKFDNIKHLIIDEMQDYSAVQLYILNYLYGCPKTILGDYNQTLVPNTSHSILDNISNIFGGENVYVEMNKSYRSTCEIANFANFVGNKIGNTVVSRHGDNVEFKQITEDKILIDLIENNKKLGYGSIAIITRNNSSAKKLYNKLKIFDEEINLIDDNIDLYDNKVCVISAYNSKGLEFDAVIVYDEDIEDNIIENNLLYIAVTRALHKLTITYKDKINDKLINFKEIK